MCSRLIPKVSIIVPVYNTEQYLRQCLDSLLSQTLVDIEIVCVNDGSTDSSPKILEEYTKNDSRVKVITQKNAGQSAARNKGLLSASGEYIGFLDSDDYVKPEMFQKLYNNSKKYDTDITMCGVTTLNSKTSQFSDEDTYLTMNLFPKEYDERAFTPSETYDFLFRICVPPWNKIFKREFLEQNSLRFIEGVNFEDNVFFLDSYLRAKSISLVRECLVVYRMASETSYSFSEKQDFKKLDFFKIMKSEKNTLQKLKLYNKLIKQFEIAKRNTLIYWYRKVHTPKIKFIYRLKLFFEYPIKDLEME